MKNNCSQNNSQKTKDRATRASRKPHSEFMCSKYFVMTVVVTTRCWYIDKTILSATLSLMERDSVLLYSNN